MSAVTADNPIHQPALSACRFRSFDLLDISMRHPPIPVAAAAFPGVAMAGRITSEANACEVLTKAVPKHVQLLNTLGGYYCELHDVSRRYHVFVFGSRHSEQPGVSPGWVGSTLVGWFAVRCSDGIALEWDMANNLPGVDFPAAKEGASK